MPGRRISGYKKNVQRIEILENCIKELLKYLDETPIVAKQYISLGQVAEIKLKLVQAIQKESNI